MTRHHAAIGLRRKRPVLADSSRWLLAAAAEDAETFPAKTGLQTGWPFAERRSCEGGKMAGVPDVVKRERENTPTAASSG